MESAVTYTVNFYFYLALFILLRMVVFNFMLKNIKRPLIMFCDVTLFVATTIWLISVWEFIWIHYKSPPLQFAVILYLMAIVDFVYNFYQYKKAKANSPLAEQNQ